MPQVDFVSFLPTLFGFFIYLIICFIVFIFSIVIFSINKSKSFAILIENIFSSSI